MTTLHSLLDTATGAQPRAPVVETDALSIDLTGLQGLAYDLALRLREHGITRQDRVIVQAQNDAMTVALIYGVSAIGACFIPVHPATPQAQLEYITENSDAAALIAPQDGTWWIEVGGAREPLPCNAGLQAPAPLATLCPDLSPEDLACIIYTSGSTGRPKGVTCLHRQMTFAIDAIATRLDYRQGDRIFCALPLSFDYGLYQIFLAIQAGATLCLQSPEIATIGLFKALSKTRATVLPGVPPMIEALATMGRRKPGQLQDLRLITNTGAAPSPAAVRSLRENFPQLGFQLMYGLTECKRASIAPVDADLERPGTCGRALDGTRIRVVGPDGEELMPGEVGEFVVSGPHLMAGYWKAEDLTAQTYPTRHATLRELRSGDYGWADADGYLYCEGRRDDIFKVRGFRVSCSEIEAACAEAPDVQHAVMIPPGPKRAATLFVQGGEVDDIKEFVRSRLEPHKVPDRVRQIADMPRTANNKFDRKALIQRLETVEDQTQKHSEKELNNA